VFKGLIGEKKIDIKHPHQYFVPLDPVFYFKSSS